MILARYARFATFLVALTGAVIGLAASPAGAQFKGATPSGNSMSVKAASAAPIDSYVVVTGSIVSHLREEYYTFRDGTGEIRVEIPDGVWAGRPVTPDNTVQLLAEVDRNRSGLVYLWVKSLEIVE